ncbi:MAG: hypothetical protein HYX62_03215 [Gammaproteobacteria bacterium]|jgi:hypothetical protein|nr:hypothetical protein [Gammaproteobacteria bacterium]
MSSLKSAAPLQIDLRYSPRLAGLVLLAHGGALALLPPLALPVWQMLLLAGVILASLTYTLNTHALLRDKRAILRLVWDCNDDWKLHTAGGKEIVARLLPGSYVHPLLVVLNFELDYADIQERLPPWARRRSVVLAPDSSDAVTLRRLRARLHIFSPKNKK